MVMPERRKVGSYEILRKLARGGMGDVYLAHDAQNERDIALKVIEQGQDQDSRETIEAERRGALLQSRLSEIDGGVVKIYETGDMDAYFFVAMEYIEGHDLSDLLRGGPAQPDDAVDIALDVCRTLHHAHTLDVTIDGKAFRGIVHGDIKPRNIRIDSENRVRVLDFGIAKALSLSRKLTRNDFGSVPYLSPERLDSGEVDAMSDLWSLGVLLYELVAGSQPYQAENTERLVRMICSRIPAPPAPDPCPEGLRRILQKSMHPDPARRYRTASDLAHDLVAFRAGMPIRAAEPEPAKPEDTDETRRTAIPKPSPEESTRRTTAPAAAPVRPVKPPAPPPRPVSRFRRQLQRAFFGGLALILTLMAFSFASNMVLWRRGQQLDRDIRAEVITDPEAIWSRWEALSKNNPQSWALFAPRHSVKKVLISAADRIIETYRDNDMQPVYENDWKRARTYLARAMEIDPSDDTARGELRLCEGHIDRINGTPHHNAAVLNEAVQNFEEAEQELPHSPDPEIGLAPVYVYGFRDIDKADATLQEAEKRGFKLSNRQKAQLADGYRDRADREWEDSHDVRGLPQEKDQVQKAADDYRRALELYQGIAPYGNANSNIVKVQSNLTAIQERLGEMQQALPFR